MSHLKSKALAAMRRIARASTVEVFGEKVQLLKDDEELWGQSLFRKWFEKTLAETTQGKSIFRCAIQFPLRFVSISFDPLSISFITVYFLNIFQIKQNLFKVMCMAEFSSPQRGLPGDGSSKKSCRC